MVCTESTTSSGPDVLDVGENGTEVGLGRKVELVVDGVGAFGPHPNLRGGLLAGDVERALLARGGPGGDLEQQRDLPTPGSPARSTTAPGTRPPPSTRSSSGTPDGGERRAPTDTGDRHRRRVTEPRPCALGDAPASATAPRLALAAPTDPLAGLHPHSEQR